MSTPNFSRGRDVDPVAQQAVRRPQGPPKWTAKYDGTCEYCQSSISEGETRVQWNEDRTAVVCASHKVAFSSEEPGR